MSSCDCDDDPLDAALTRSKKRFLAKRENIVPAPRPEGTTANAVGLIRTIDWTKNCHVQVLFGTVSLLVIGLGCLLFAARICCDQRSDAFPFVDRV